jgi:hypothetical protein
MTRDVLVSLLRQGSTGSEILQILDTLGNGMVSDDDASYGGEPTADSIDF